MSPAEKKAAPAATRPHEAVKNDGIQNIVLDPDYDKSIDFLQTWNDGGPWVLTAIAPDRRFIETQTFDESQVEELLAWLAKHGDERRNIYFHVNTAMRCLDKKADKSDIKSVDWLHVDVDPDVGEDIHEEQKRILTLLQKSKGLPEPTMIVFSGGGYQAFWKLAEPIEINGDVAKAEDAERYNLQIEIMLGADSCHNADRIMRLPGTINFPNEKKRRRGQRAVMAEVVERHDGCVYSIDQFEMAPVVSELVGDGGRPKVDVNVGQVQRRIQSMDELPDTVSDRAKTAIAQGRDPDQPLKDKNSKSEWVYYVTCELVRAEVDDDVIYAIITDPEWPISEHVLAQGNAKAVRRYAVRQIRRAKEFAIDPRLVEMNDKYALVESVGGKTRIMKQHYDPVMKRDSVEFLRSDGFKLRYANQKVVVEVPGTKNGKATVDIKEIPLGAWWLTHPNRRTYDDIVFAPGIELSHSRFNLWQGFAFDPKTGDCALFLDHIHKNLCRGVREHSDYLIKWMARMVQHPECQAEVAVVMRGEKGTGKGFFAKTFGRLFGPHYAYVSNPEHITGKFNAALMNAKIVFADECYVSGRATHEAAQKAIITEPTIRVEPKGVDTLEVRNFLALIMATNAEWAVPATKDERRYFVIEVGDKQQRDRKYFAAIAKQMKNGGYEALLHYLMYEVDLEGWDHTAAPETKALREQKEYSLPPLQLALVECLREGCVPVGTNLGAGVVRFGSNQFVEWVKARTRREDLNTAQLRVIMNKLGFSKDDRRPRGWELPPLDNARTAWDEKLFPVDWDAGEDEQWSIQPF